MDMLISIVVPVYKAEQFIKDCIESILAQTDNNYEAIFVNDGSPDRSADIIAKYVNEYPNFKLLSQSNKGVTAARATGVANAIGEWVTFVDADDLLLPDAISIFRKVVKKHDCDIVVASMPSIGRCYRLAEIPIEEYRRALIEQLVYTGPCGKLFRRHLFGSHVMAIPREVVVAEDMLMNIRLAFSTQKAMILIPESVYQVRTEVNSQSAMKRFKGGWDFDVIFDQYLLESVPANERKEYLLSIVKFRQQIWHGTFRKQWCIPKEVYNTEYYKRIVMDMETVKYKGPWLLYCNIKMRSPLLRMPLDMIGRVYGLIKRYVKHKKTNKYER